MFRKLFGSRGPTAPPPPPPTPPPAHPPYPAGSPANALYDLLFCDDPAGFAPKRADDWAPWQTILYRAEPDAAEVAALAADGAAESRIRLLAYNWLRANGPAPLKGLVLGVVFEIPLAGGLDTLAAYADGRVRYLNQSGKVAVIEPGGLAEASRMAEQLVALAGPLAARIGPWDAPRRPPPALPNARVNLLVSDGLYFGEGPFEVMARDPMGGPLFALGAQLLKLVTDTTVKPSR